MDISISATQDFAGGDFSIGFDSNAFSLAPPNARTVGQTSGFSLVSNPQAGSLKISMANATGISSASGPVFEIFLVANGNAAAGAHSLRLTAATLFNLNGESIPCSRRDGSVSVIGSSQGQDEDDEDEGGGDVGDDADDGFSDPRTTSAAAGSISENASTSSSSNPRVVTRRVETSGLTASPVAPGESFTPSFPHNNSQARGEAHRIDSLALAGRPTPKTTTNPAITNALPPNQGRDPVGPSPNRIRAENASPLGIASATDFEKAETPGSTETSRKERDALSGITGGTNIPALLVACMGGFLLLAIVKKRAGLW